MLRDTETLPEVSFAMFGSAKGVDGATDEDVDVQSLYATDGDCTSVKWNFRSLATYHAAFQCIQTDAAVHGSPRKVSSALQRKPPAWWSLRDSHCRCRSWL
ncbi:hypothetical protein BAUCODRAFT_118131 [Baudoinia panamericana UAMH 10762]|uniref:Uncharacterized protein n=1 Tax=Baudoinia panamericana (strain UAMH 10762) TaxID=717646 RepID=M2NME3_BAUPA|nr:uncharacterized protein BAUCODRAFT_118131 [Baudoinia panamericana UAMH 10762]EMD00351.1 hypothetical protein BAUCODRAFT_118131 [Baudoinia panamericana UAMH 10762]